MRSRLLARAVLMFALSACSEAPGGNSGAPPNILLITLDTLRADHLGCYGYELDTSPEIDRIASESTRYARAWSTSPWTLPSHASLFTALYPFEHGAHTIEPARTPDGRLQERVIGLVDERDTLAEFLAARGYATAGFVANTAYLNPSFQVNQGFATWGVERVRARPLNAKALSWIDARLGARRASTEAEPFFLFLNYMDVHRPYNIEPRPDDRLPAPSQVPPGKLLDELCLAVLPTGSPPPPELVEQIVGQYDVAIANLSQALGELRAALEERGLWEDMLVVITSDHGEYFGEHLLVEHSKDIYEEALRVPLIVKSPRQEQARVEQRPVAGVDVASMIVRHLPSELRAPGLELFGLSDSRPLLAENWFTRIKDLAQPYGARFNRIRTAVWFDDYKYIASSDGRVELYDLVEDPREQLNLVAERGIVASGAAQALEDYQSARRAAPGTPVDFALDEQRLDEMRALGYIGGEDD